MHSPQTFEIHIVEGLYPHGDAVDTRVTKALELSGLDGCRIGFERDFCIFGQAPYLPDLADDSRDRLRLHQAGRASAEEHGIDAARAAEARRMFDLTAQSITPCCVIDLAPDM